ncbi:hypothetical protein Hdeb2414_s0007g00234591 [Helianthus debilis subsp. tardiflorus]
MAGGDFHRRNHSTSNTTMASDSSSSSFLTDNDDDDDFILELTRQMEDYMLQEDDDHNKHNSVVPKEHGVLVKNQNQHRIVENSKRGRRWKMAESTQRMKYYRGRRVTSSGSGMRAVFLNRPGSKTGCNGTGVFLPPSANCSTAQGRNIPGCSTALVPTRVLEALEQHFNNLKSLSPLHSQFKTESIHQGQKSGMQQKSRWRSTSIDRVEKKLPQEWTY